MSRCTTMRTFADATCAQPAHDPQFVQVVSGPGHMSTDVFLGQNAYFNHRAFAAEDDRPAFAVVEMLANHGDDGAQLNLFIDGQALERAVAMRDALNRAIRAVRHAERKGKQ